MNQTDRFDADHVLRNPVTDRERLLVHLFREEEGLREYELRRLELKVEALEDETCGLEQELYEKEYTNSELITEIDELKNSIAKSVAGQKIAELESQLQKSVSMVDSYRNQYIELEEYKNEEIEDLRDSLSSSADENAELLNEVLLLRSKVENLSGVASEMLSDLKARRGMRARLITIERKADDTIGNDSETTARKGRADIVRRNFSAGSDETCSEDSRPTERKGTFAHYEDRLSSLLP